MLSRLTRGRQWGAESNLATQTPGPSPVGPWLPGLPPRRFPIATWSRGRPLMIRRLLLARVPSKAPIASAGFVEVFWPLCRCCFLALPSFRSCFSHSQLGFTTVCRNNIISTSPRSFIQLLSFHCYPIATFLSPDIPINSVSRTRGNQIARLGRHRRRRATSLDLDLLRTTRSSLFTHRLNRTDSSISLSIVTLLSTPSLTLNIHLDSVHHEALFCCRCRFRGRRHCEAHSSQLQLPNRGGHAVYPEVEWRLWACHHHSHDRQ